jgi:endonuclease YncB( thermonuclease family)
MMIDAPYVCEAPVVTDGDSIRCGDGRRLRLLGIDAPEMGACPRQRVCVVGSGPASKASLLRAARGTVTYRPIKLDRYSRTIAVVYANGINLSCAQLAVGQAEYKPAWDDGRIIGRECR